MEYQHLCNCMYYVSAKIPTPPPLKTMTYEEGTIYNVQRKSVNHYT
jgi:hypothetical protein